VKRSNEFAVGLAVLAALGLVIGGALWLSETDVNQKKISYSARFRTVGGLGVGGPVTLRGVKVGRVEAIRLVQNDWVETEFSIDRSVELPRKPAVISASASLFGEWTANIVPYEPLPADPNLRDALIESDQAGGDAWPGATLPDIGQLTAQASRIAGDVGDITRRIGQAFDSTALKNLQQSVKDLAAISRRMRSPSTSAASPSRPSQITTNSSPPNLNTRSDARTAAMISRPMRRSTASPAAWPKRSLKLLKCRCRPEAG
jgi:phospholipid/cholesterol/gamma-HCH transport system substrate-binding protein